MKVFRMAIDLAGNLIQNVATPVNPTDAANKAYVDNKNEVSVQNEEPTDGSELWVDWDAT